MTKLQSQLTRTYSYLQGALINAEKLTELDPYLISYELVKFSTLYFKATNHDLEILPSEFIVDTKVNERLTNIFKRDVTHNDIKWFFKYFTKKA
jgi:hypothetical protein